MKGSEAGKGGDTRPRFVSDEEWDDNFYIAFRRKRKNDLVMKHHKKRGSDDKRA